MTDVRFDQTAEGWDAASDEYARLFASFTSLFANDVVALCPPRSTDAVLEIAAGAGLLTVELAKRAAAVLATDLSPRMIAHVEEACKTAGVANVRTAVMNAESLALHDAAYDAVYCMFGVSFFVDRPHGLKEMARVLKPGGRCVITTWHSASRMLAPVAAAIEKIMPGTPAAQAVSGPGILRTHEEFQQELGAAGFTQIEVRQVSHPLAFADRAVYVREFPGANPMGIAMQNMLPGPVFDALRTEVDKELAAEFGEGPVELPCIANIATAVKA